MVTRGTREGAVMIRVSVEVRRGDISYRVAVQARSIRRALEILGGRNPGCELRVVFPIDPESFFVRGEGVERIEPEAA